MKDFRDWMGAYQSSWRHGRVHTDEQGFYGASPRPWILPATHWEEGLWPPLRDGAADSIAAYLGRVRAAKHTGVNNLKSSWIACANLYFPFRATPDGADLLAGFLRAYVSDEVQKVDRLELEYAEEYDLHPSELLGENDGQRGKGQTSPDLAIVVNGETGIVLTESKLTEHSFYACSARTQEDKPRRPANPDPARCLDARSISANPVSLCHQVVWGRKYWERLGDAVDRNAFGRLKACPAAFAGYQLFRQQALAEGYAQKYSLVVSAVAYDDRNEELTNSLKSTGITSFPAGWRALFKGKAQFAAWTHQSWVDWVRQHHKGVWAGWLEWIEARYGYGSTLSAALGGGSDSQ